MSIFTDYKFGMIGATVPTPDEFDSKSLRIRDKKFMAFIHQVLYWFAQYPALTAVKLTTVLKANIQANPFAVGIEHHFALVTEGIECPEEDVFAFLARLLPYEQMANGSYTIARDSADIRAFEELLADARSGEELAAEYAGLLATIASRIDAVIPTVDVIHSFGFLSTNGRASQ